MKKALTVILILVAVGGVFWVSNGWTPRRTDPKVAKFNANAENLILGIQQYKEFMGTYPSGNNIQIAKALFGRGEKNEKRVLILSVRGSDVNDKGEILDPWGTPLQFYFSHNEVLIRSAGPNKAWEDSGVPTADDLYRCAGIDKK
jgi:hypothetical protein